MITKTTIIATDIPDELLEEVEVSPRPLKRLEDAGLVILDLKQGLDQANSQIRAIACIEKHRKEALKDQNKGPVNDVVRCGTV